MIPHWIHSALGLFSESGDKPRKAGGVRLVRRQGSDSDADAETLMHRIGKPEIA